MHEGLMYDASAGPLRVLVLGLEVPREVEGVRFRQCSFEELAGHIGWAEVLVIATFDRHDFSEIWAGAEHLRWVHSFSAGVDWLLDPVLARGPIVLTNASGVLDDDIAEYVAAAVLAVAKDVPGSVRLQDQRRWQHRVTTGVRHQRALVVGPGSIGCTTGSLLKALGMDVDAAGTRARADHAVFGRVRASADLASYVGEYDHVILTVPLTEATRHLVDAGVLAAMKASSCLINVARGPVVDENALAAALASRSIGSAVLDVFTVEPLPDDSPLWDLDNVILTSHMAGDADDFRDNLRKSFDRNLSRYLSGEPLAGVVDKTAGFVRP